MKNTQNSTASGAPLLQWRSEAIDMTNDQMNESDSLTPNDVREQFTEAARKRDSDDVALPPSMFERLLAPRTRVQTLDVLLDARGEWRTARELYDAHPALSQSSFDRQVAALQDFGLVETGPKRGNAVTYRLRSDHPAVQVFVMLDNVATWGRTPDLLDDQFTQNTVEGSN